MAIEMQRIAYRDGETPLTGVLVWEETHGGPRPGILVVHGGAGRDAHAEGRARRMAALGYVAFACDMYGDGVAGDRQRVMAAIAELRDDRARLCRRAEAGLAVLAAQPQCDGRLAAVGYCFGGMTVLELARDGGVLAGVASIHGSLRTARPAGPGAVAARILVCHGALDPHVPLADVTALVEEMTQAGADWQLIVYGGALHGFTHEPVAGVTAPEVPGVAYDALADARSSRALQDFFAELFDPAPAAADRR